MNHNRIVVASLDGQVQQLTGSGEPGIADGDLATAHFDRPRGLVLANGLLYVADTKNHAIRVLDLQRGMVSTLKLAGLD